MQGKSTVVDLVVIYNNITWEASSEKERHVSLRGVLPETKDHLSGTVTL